MPYSTKEIRGICAGFLRGDTAEVEIARGWVRGVVRGGNWRFDDPESVEQDALLRLFNMGSEGRIRDAGGFQKLVYTVAKYVSVDAYQRQRRASSRESPDEEPERHAGSSEEAEARALRRERIDALVYVFQKLPEACREIWRRLYSEGAPSEEVASTLGISVNNLRVRVHRCLRKAQELRASFAEIA